MEMFVVFVLGVVFGAIVTNWLLKATTNGIIRVDNSDPEDGPYLFLEITKRGMSEIQGKKYITLTIVHEDSISQK